MAVAIFLFFVVASVLVFVLVMWTGRLDKAIETWRAIRPTLLVFIIVAGGALFILLRSIEKDAEVDAVSTAEADATPVQRIPGNYSAAECIQSTTGLVVVIHTDEGYIRFDAEPLLQSPALWSVDRSRMARWIDRPQNLIKQPLQS